MMSGANRNQIQVSHTFNKLQSAIAWVTINSDLIKFSNFQDGRQPNRRMNLQLKISEVRKTRPRKAPRSTCSPVLSMARSTRRTSSPVTSMARSRSTGQEHLHLLEVEGQGGGYVDQHNPAYLLARPDMDLIICTPPQQPSICLLSHLK